ncbi:MAG TPA: Plug domain-containing protein, partial [Longimicrobiales bacterium]|nr:Plug domain-containing protein [Longimicrobiales bacterium]
MLALLLLALPLGAEGQVRIEGRVIDNVTERPLSEAVVTFRTREGRFLGRLETGDGGTFEFEVENQAAVQIHVRRASFKSNTMPLLYFGDRKFFQVEVRLDPQAILLAPLEVITWSDVDPSPMLNGFRERLRTGMGVYITREQIERRRPTYMADLLREVPGVTVTGSGIGNRPIIQIGRTLSQGCEAQIWVDGFLLNRRLTAAPGAPMADVRLDDAVHPLSVEGIEIYRGLASVPAQFLNPDARCGVIVVWTRRGG